MLIPFYISEEVNQKCESLIKRTSTPADIEKYMAAKHNADFIAVRACLEQVLSTKIPNGFFSGRWGLTSEREAAKQLIKRMDDWFGKETKSFER